MSKINTLATLIKQKQYKKIYKTMKKQIFSIDKMCLFYKEFDNKSLGQTYGDDFVKCRQSTSEDIESIIRIWPEEFSGLRADHDLLCEELQKRSDEGQECFVACVNNEIVGAIWCRPWAFDSALPENLRGKSAYEPTNIFTVEKLRGKGVGPKMIAHAMTAMAQKGMTTAYARVLQERKASIAVMKKMGFRNLGILTNGVFFGRQFSRLDGSG